MAAKGPKARRGRGKGTEPEEIEPTTSPEAPLPPLDADVGAMHGDAEPTPSVQERQEAETASEPVEPSKPVEPEEPATWRVSNLVVAGLAVVLALAVLGGALLYAPAGDPDRLDQHAQRLDAFATQAETQTNRLGAAEDAIAGLQSEVAQVTTSVGQLQTSLGDLQSVADANRQNLEGMAQRIEDLRSTVPAGGTVAGEAVGELQDRIGALDERLSRFEQAGNLDELAGTVARLQEEITELRQQSAARVEQAASASALGQAYAALTERIAAGAPFADELEAVTAELPSAPGLEILRPLAGEGVPTVSDLQARLARIAAELPHEEPDQAAAADGVWETLRQRVAGMVTVRRADEADWSAVLARADEALQNGDVEAAIAEVEQVGDTASGEVESWLADAHARREAQAGLNELSDAVLRQFAGRR